MAGIPGRRGKEQIFKFERPSGDKSGVGFLGQVSCLDFIPGAYGQESRGSEPEK